MALFPVQGTSERAPLGLFKAHPDWEGGEGGLVVRIDGYGTNSPSAGTQNEPRINYAEAGQGDYSGAMYGLLDEQLVRPETLLGQFLPPNQDPVGLGPRTDLSSGRPTVWLAQGMFLTDHFAIEFTDTSDEGEGYGEPANLTAGDALLATNADASSGERRGTLCDSASATTLSVGTATTRIYFMQLVDDPRDLLNSLVQPAPRTGMFREGPRMLVHQA